MPLGAFKATVLGAAGSGGGSAGNFEYIAGFTGDATTSNYSFTSLPTDYKTLRVVIHARDTGNQWRPIIRINNDSGSYYRVSQMIGDNANFSGSGQTSLSGVYMGIVPKGNHPYTATIDFPEYNSTGMVCPVLLQIAQSTQTTGNGEGPLTIQSGALFNGSAAISQINLVGANGYNLSTGSTVSLFGFKDS
tara:strand:+ start:73 stop:645 length:573 start_codon:yes stop_codon:yes gene_type:complete